MGLTERAARSRGLNVRVVEMGWGIAAAPLLGEDFKGVVKFVVDEDRPVLVGATFVGPGLGELTHAATIAIVGEVTLDRLWYATPSFPTLSEIWLRFLEAYWLQAGVQCNHQGLVGGGGTKEVGRVETLGGEEAPRISILHSAKRPLRRGSPLRVENPSPSTGCPGRPNDRGD